MTQLHDACERGDLEQVTFLLSNEECDINSRNIHGNQPLHIACKNADLEIVKVLLKDQKCYSNTRNKDGDTPLHLACHNKVLPIVRLLLEQKCSTYIRNKKGEIAQRIPLNKNGDCLLHIACRWESIDIVRNLITTERCDLNFRNGDLNTPLHIACYQKSLQIIRLLLESRCNISIPNKKGVIAQNIPLSEDGDCLLHIACQWVDMDIVIYLISDQKCNLNITNNKWNTPLHIACFKQSLTIIKLLLEMKCKVKISNKKGVIAQNIPLNEDGDCLLHIACRWGDVDIVRYLIMDENCDLNIQNGTSNSPLHIACYWKSLDIIKLLLEVKCDTKISNKKSKSAHDIPLNDNGDLLLHVSCQWGDVDIVRYLAIDEKCDINLQNVDMNTPLHFACYQKSLPIIKLLLEMRCSTNIPNKISKTAQAIPLNEDGDYLLHIACQWGDVDTVRYLITDEGYNVCDQSYTSKNTPLHVAVLYGQDDITGQLLLCDECGLNVQNIKGDTPLHAAVNENRTVSFYQLIAIKQCDLNIQNTDSETPLHIAVRQVQNDTVIQLLSLENCNPDLKNSEGNTPLHIACYMKSLHIIRQLLERSCSIQLPNKKSETAQDIPLNEDGDYLLHIACQWGDVGIVRYLITEGCKPTAQSYSSKNTALHIAVVNGQKDTIIELLLCKECDLSIQNKYGDTPLHTAVRLNQTAAIAQLLAHPQCNISVQNKDGDTALHVAVNVPVSQHKYDLNTDTDALFHTAVVYSQDDTIIQLLSCKECDVNIENKQGDTPLHIAVRQSKTTAITQLLAHRQCNINCQNGMGITPLHIATMYGQDDALVQLLSYKECDLNVQNKEGDTPLHSAVRQNSTSAIYKLLSHRQCNANIKNKAGYTALHTAVRYGEDNTAVQLLSFRECDPNIQNVEGDTPLHTAAREDRSFIITLLLTNKQCNPNVQNADGDTPLHIAVRENRIPIISHFLDDAKCDMNILNSDHLTPLLIAIKQNNSSVAATLLQQKKCNPLLCDLYKNTSLHFACRGAETNQEMVRVAKHLLTTVDPMCVNNAGQTPIELTTNYQLIQAITHMVQCKTKQSVQTYINMFIVGNPETGKSTLVKAVCKEATSILWKIVPKMFRRVKDVPLHTAGIIPTTFKSKSFGNVVLHDLAGQVEYYTSHAAVIQSTVISTPPGFIVVFNLSESEEKIVQTLRYWWSFIDNHAARSSAPPQVILVGSRADLVKSTGRSVQEKMTQIANTLKKLSTSFHFAGQVALDCRDPASKKLQHFCSLVNQSCTVLRKTADVDLRCHVLYAFLLERFNGKVACTVSDIATSVKENRELLPQDPASLIPLISTLSDKGLLLQVKGGELHADWWIILQKQALLGEINGVIFAPATKDFRQCKDLSWSTGVVPFSKLKNEFPDYNPNMITEILTHLEFCFKIEDHQTLELLKEEAATMEDMSPDVLEGYYFPALVSVENPLHIWEENDDMCCKCGWVYQCIEKEQFLTTQFLHVLILRLAFTFALQLDPGDSREDSLSLCRKCSVWKHGIAWINRVRIETVVEVGLQYQSVIVMMRCPKGKEAKCAQLRSEVIQKVLEAKDEHCKAVKMSESFIHPANVKYPFTEEDKFYSLTEIARGIGCKGEEANALNRSGRNPIPVQDLLLFDPYTTDTSTGLLRDLFSEKHSMDETVRKQALESINSESKVVTINYYVCMSCFCSMKRLGVFSTLQPHLGQL